MIEEQIQLAIIECEKRILDLQQVKMDLDFAGQDLSTDAAEQRASNAQMGRGLGGALLGAKYRASARRSAASKNAALGRQLAQKRALLNAEKQNVRSSIQSEKRRISELKLQLKQAKLAEKAAEKTRAKMERSALVPPAPPVQSAPPPPPSISDPNQIKEHLRALKQRFENGELTAVQYETARIELLQPHLRS